MLLAEAGRASESRSTRQARVAAPENGAIVISIFRCEIRNVLLVSERRERITPAKGRAYLSLLAKLPIVVELLPPEAGVLDIARDHRITVYDASYIELAFRDGLPLASLHKTMKRVARVVGVSVWPAEA